MGIACSDNLRSEYNTIDKILLTLLTSEDRTITKHLLKPKNAAHLDSR